MQVLDKCVVKIGKLQHSIGLNQNFRTKFWIMGFQGNASSPPEDFGFELELRAHSENIKTRADVAMVLVHWRLSRYHFRCIGDSVFMYKVPSELLPQPIGWDGTVETYKVKYSRKGIIYLVEMTLKGDEMTVKAYTEDKIVTTRMNVGSAIGEDLNVNMARVRSLADRLDRNLVQELLRLITQKEEPTNTSTKKDQ